MKALSVLLLICITVGIANARHNRDQSRTQSKRRDRSDDSRERIVIENKGKIVNNGLARENERMELRPQNLLDQLGYTLSVAESEATDMETLLKQKFLLEILLNVNGALINKELHELGVTLVLDEQRYVGGLDSEMLQLLELCINNAILTKAEKFNALNPAHVQQMLGLYKLLLRAKDWETFQCNVCFARIHFNGELLVNALLLAVGQRNDTVGLIIPGIDEILPELYYDKQLLQRARAVNINNLIRGNTNMKPQFSDIIKPYSGGSRIPAQKAWQEWRQEGMAKQSAGGVQNQRWSVMHPQKTWQQWRQERLEKLANLEKLKQPEREELAKLVLPVLQLNQADSTDLDERISYLTRDVGLNNFWYSFNIDSLRKMSLQIPVTKETTKSDDERLKPIEYNIVKISKALPDIGNTNRLLYTNRRRLSETKRGTQILESEVQSQEVAEKNRRIVNNQENVREEVHKAADVEIEKNEIKYSDSETLGLIENMKSKESPKAPIQILNVEDRFRVKDSSDSTSRLLKVNRRRMGQMPNSSQQNSDIFNNYILPKDLQQTSVNNERLLRVGRRRLNPEAKSIQSEKGKQTTIGIQKNTESLLQVNQVVSQNINDDRIQSTDDKRLQNELKNSVDPLPNQNLKTNNERLQTVIDDVGIQKELEQTPNRSERLLRINRRRLTQNSNDNFPIRVNQNVGKSQDQVEGNVLPLEKTSIDTARLLKVNRRRRTEILTKNNVERLEQPKSLLERMGELYKNLLPLTQLNGVARGESEEFSGENYSESSAEDDAKTQTNSGSSEEFRDMSLDDISQAAAEIDSLRLPRSIAKIRNIDLKEQRAGEIMLTTMQQILVRLKMERLTNILESKTKLLNENVVPLSRRKLFNLLNETKGIEQIMDFIVKTQLKDTKNVNFMEGVGEVLMGRQNLIGQDMLQFLARIMESAKLESDFTKQLSGPFSLVMDRVITLIDAYTDRLDGYNNADLILDDVKLHDVKIDRLQTFFDTTDSALINLILDQKEVDLKNLRIIPVARQERLNHKPFTLTFDITNESRAPRSVVIRIFLGSKLDDAARVISFEENRRNFLLLDAFNTQLAAGRTTIKRKSTDITWTSNDSTSYMQIYKQVMLAIDGKLNLELGKSMTGNCNFPQRLLLPRGLAKGLPMQLFVIVTPVTEEDAKLQQEAERTDSGICGMGTAAIKLDKLPLGFPLDRRINYSKYLLEGNAILKDVLIYHQADTVVKDIES